MSIKIIIILILAYLIGSIPNGYIISKKFYGVDITKYGSGNIDMTNVQRVLGNKPAIAVLVLDLSKVAIAILLGGYALHSYSYMMLSGILAVIGHNYSIFMPHFKGGKGVAATYGIAALINFSAAILSALVFLKIVMKTKYVSLGSIISIALYTAFLILLKENKSIVLWSGAFPIPIIYPHKDNNKRLIKGIERKFGGKGKN
jgi:glycerol-3-phosphate acyltransferase PlsY